MRLTSSVASLGSVCEAEVGPGEGTIPPIHASWAASQGCEKDGSGAGTCGGAFIRLQSEYTSVRTCFRHPALKEGTAKSLKWDPREQTGARGVQEPLS